VFIDFDNIEIGVRQTLNTSFDAGIVLEALKERGDVVSKTAYSDWQRAGSHSRMLTQHAIKMVQRNLTPGGDKNGADINLALDALEMAFTHTHINAFAIVGGDSDFISLVEKLKQYDKKVFVVGGRQFTSGILQRNCTEFIAYENLTGVTTGTPSSERDGRRTGGRHVRVERTPVEQAIPLVTRALAVLTEREVSPQLGLLKSTLLQLDSTFSERSYGAGSFRDFVEKLAKAGVLSVYQGKGGWLVGPPDTGAVAQAAVAVNGENGGDEEGVGHATEAAPAQVSSVIAVIGTPAEGLQEFRKLLGTAAIRRWPMYLRNVKQLFRQTTPPFDERAYGYASLVDLLRAAHKDGIVRVDRDRQGVVRVFQMGPVSGQPAAPMVVPIEPVAMPIEVDADEVEILDEPQPAVIAPVDVDDDNFGNVDPAALPARRARRPRRAPTAATAATTAARPRRPRRRS